ncbi:hypothetical protein [Sphingomonas aerophila]|jgi:hypothetical protein|uniref:Uncharacterized protein n=1 Tax=Sphingomonas aerophila TaxID=1344948 RepID=A0A7W9BDH8_9SPHN|nr:hypothetical protein [Sphingomonas aerophila]MBB5715227.1 hypothetical protein [Sphingomonas aerophila]
MGEVLGALLEYFAVSLPSGQEGRKLTAIWLSALALTISVAIGFILSR